VSKSHFVSTAAPTTRQAPVAAKLHQFGGETSGNQHHAFIYCSITHMQ
jgi:hypothetical protein